MCWFGRIPKLRIADGDLIAETQIGSVHHEPRQQITGWMELALAADADAAEIPLWLAMVDLIGLGQSTAKANGAVCIVPIKSASDTG